MGPGQNVYPPPPETWSECLPPPGTRSECLPPPPPHLRLGQNVYPPGPGQNVYPPGTRSECPTPHLRLGQNVYPLPPGPGQNVYPPPGTRSECLTPPPTWDLVRMSTPSPPGTRSECIPPPPETWSECLPPPRDQVRMSTPPPETWSECLPPPPPPKLQAGGRYASYWNAFLLQVFVYRGICLPRMPWDMQTPPPSIGRPPYIDNRPPL